MITPPTDNLYKFISIAGLVLFFISISFPFSKASNLAVKQAELWGQYERLKVDAQSLNGELMVAVADLNKVTQSQYKELQQKFQNQNVKRTEVETNEKVVAVFRQEIRFYTWIGIIGATVGFFMAVTGFVFWYKRVQKFEDAILQKKAQEANQPA